MPWAETLRRRCQQRGPGMLLGAASGSGDIHVTQEGVPGDPYEQLRRLPRLGGGVVAQVTVARSTTYLNPGTLWEHQVDITTNRVRADVHGTRSSPGLREIDRYIPEKSYGD